MKLSAKTGHGEGSFVKWTSQLPVLLVSLWILQTGGMNGSHTCVEKQRYNVTKRIKYRAPMSVRTYEWCFSVPPRCSRYHTELRDLTKLETEERTMDVAVCCPGFAMKASSCHAKCPSGKTGHKCTEACPKNKWGPSCSMDCVSCPTHSSCSPYTGSCVCSDGWKGERCELPMEERRTITSSSTMATKLSTSDLSRQQSTPIITIANTERPRSTIPTTSNLLTTETSIVPTNRQVHSTAVAAVKTESTRQESTNTDSTIDSVKNSTITKDYIQDLEINTDTLITTPWTATDKPILTTTKKFSSTDDDELTSFATEQSIKSKTKPYENDWITTPFTTTTEVITKTSTTSSTVKNDNQKEIWIKPTQKGDSILIKTKEKHNLNDPHKTRKYLTADKTTTKTIMVSIIPTSIGQTTLFKRITVALSGHTQPHSKSSTKESSFWKYITPTSLTTKITTTTFQPSLEKKPMTVPSVANSIPRTLNSLLSRNFSNYLSNELITTMKSTTKPNETISSKTYSSQPFEKYIHTNYTKSSHEGANENANTTLSTKNTSTAPSATKPSYKRSTFIVKVNYSSISTRKYLLTTPAASKITKTLHTFLPATTFPIVTNSSPTNSSPTNSSPTNSSPTNLQSRLSGVPLNKLPSKPSVANNFLTIHRYKTNEDITSKPITPELFTDTGSTKMYKDAENVSKLTYTNSLANRELTNSSDDGGDEVFDVLTEPEHITAVVGGETERNTDLASVLSIVGGVVFSLITVAVVIVMMERCRRSRYDEVAKYDSVMMKNVEDEQPPPYSRSIFHTPLPDPPNHEKMHYQPISTLDRNLKQFMRPVTIQSISPVLMESFRDVLECHYDHLPARNSRVSLRSGTFSCHLRSSTTPSIETPVERFCISSVPECFNKIPVTETSVEKLKEDVKINTETLDSEEPLYAEIPWRASPLMKPTSLHSHSEAVTEL